MVNALVVFLFPILFLCARVFTRVYNGGGSGAVKELRSAKRMQQWWRRRSNELVNSNNPTIPLIKRPDEGTWAATWRKKRKR
jgi:hypothetical protein